MGFFSHLNHSVNEMGLSGEYGPIPVQEMTPVSGMQQVLATFLSRATEKGSGK